MNTIRYIRKEPLGVSQIEMASISGATQATVSRWETGCLYPDLSHLSRIRAEVKAKGRAWSDAWFFDVPPHEG